MTLLQESTGARLQCDGCGRIDAGAATPLSIREYVVTHPTTGETATLHYCAGCAANRGSTSTERLDFAWSAGPMAEFAPNETKEQRQAREAARGPFIPGSGEDSLTEK